MYGKNKIPQELIDTPTIKKAIEVLENMSLNKEEREIYEARLKWLRDEEMAIKTAKRKGIEQGIAQGKEEEKIEIAKKSLAKGIDIEIISSITGLKKDEIIKPKFGK